MSARAAVVIVQDGQVALIERNREDRHYFTFPGGGVDEGETPEQTAVREAKEELGFDVVLRRLVAEIWFQGKPQWYYLAEVVGGVFGTGVGPEMVSPYLERGTYLHLGFGLRYAGAATYALNESRRVKFYERNYFDHPAFGVIALVTPAQGGRAAGR
jgi:8-oxo-dGTP pyrophosphatase MutT (NUDIX family)